VNRTNSKVSTLIDLLRSRALQQPELPIYSYLADGEIEEDNLTLAALDSQARAIGALLQDYGAGGQRALLLYPPGL
jgi:acyl-CoA synthetase (AMP-forming)/AMP-acid ligase II